MNHSYQRRKLIGVRNSDCLVITVSDSNRPSGAISLIGKKIILPILSYNSAKIFYGVWSIFLQVYRVEGKEEPINMGTVRLQKQCLSEGDTSQSLRICREFFNKEENVIGETNS